ncbi:MAG: CocE/NonD family hydrolase [Gemmatimonadetes bacterium]|nr:CocE/NonD family hydrolase [Gemmatimonadota bacterium]
MMIETRDGVRLATDIYRPARNGIIVEEPLPMILHRTPYGKSSRGQAERARYFAAQGYVSVVQDIRGRYKSEGTFSKYHDFDAPDGYDTIEWLAKLPYTEPRVGMWGTSYGAHTQADAAKLSPPSLATIVLTDGGTSDSWDHLVGYHGAVEIGRQVTWAFVELQGEPAFLQLSAADGPPLDGEELLNLGKEWLAHLPLRKGLNPLAVAPNFEDYVLEMATLGVDRDYRYFKGIGMNWVQYYDQTADVPMYFVGGWYDVLGGGTIDNFVGLSARKQSPLKLLMGPWDHGGQTSSSAGEVEFGPEAAISDYPTAFHLRWFDHVLKGKDTGIDRELPIRLFVMGTGDGHKDENGRLFHGGYWRDEESWPLPGTEFTPYYFHAHGSLRAERPQAERSSTTFTFDPLSPVPTIGGSLTRFPAGGYDQREREGWFGAKPPYLPLKARRDVVVFQTEPLEDDMEVVGPIRVKLFASSTAVDTDFTAKLVDVHPPSKDYPFGFDLNLTDGIVRARYRNRPTVKDLGPKAEELLTPGQVYEFTIMPFPTANVFKKGHRIRVDISSSNFPRFDVNPNTGEPVGRHRRMLTADNTIHHGATYASHVMLPIVPSRR